MSLAILKIMISDIKLGDIVLGTRLNRKVTGKVAKILPGAVVIINNKNSEERVVIDADRIFKLIKKS